MAYLNSYKNQNWLIPQSIKDMIPKEHVCFFVEEFVESLDFSNFDELYDGAGHPAYHPRILMKILIQGMLSRIRSSRKLAAAARESFIFMYLAEKVNPDFRTIARFRKENAAFVKQAFKETVRLASDYKVIDLSFIGIDGSKIKAQASKKQYFDKAGLNKLDNAIDKMMEEDIALDELEEQIFGDKEEGLTGIDERDLRKIVRENFKNKDKEKLKEKITRAKEELEQNNLKKVSLSDPESRVMQHAKRYSEPSYNTQFSVTKNQIIVANDVCHDGHDAHQFVPQIKNVKENVKLRKDTKVGVDCGYSDGINIKFAEDNKIDLYVPSRAQAQEFDGKEQSLNHDKYEYDWKKDELIVGKERFRFRGEYTRKDGKRILSYYSEKLKKKKDVPFYFRERLRMRNKMEKPESKEVYRLRKSTVEPVIGNIKQNLGFREFLLKGLDKVRIEMNLVSIAHNLGKIWRLTRASKC
ncbi:IS1182 family transposase [archaeon]|nr:IS1182 family transposase [archaeon]